MTSCGVCGAPIETRGVIERDPDKPRCPNCLRPETPLASLCRERIQRDRDEDERDAARERDPAESYSEPVFDPDRCREAERELQRAEERSERITELYRRRRQLMKERDQRRADWDRWQSRLVWLAYGWNTPLMGPGIVRWSMTPAGVFRPLALWVWEPSEWGVLTSVLVIGQQYLKEGVPLKAYIAPVRLSAYWNELHEGQDVPRFTCHRELRRSVRAVLETRETPRRLDCPTLGLGQTLELDFRGSVRALALLGKGPAEPTDGPSGRWRAQPAPPARATPARNGT
jgi:hypothetical protein